MEAPTAPIAVWTFAGVARRIASWSVLAAFVYDYVKVRTSGLWTALVACPHAPWAQKCQDWTQAYMDIAKRRSVQAVALMVVLIATVLLIRLLLRARRKWRGDKDVRAVLADPREVARIRRLVHQNHKTWSEVPTMVVSPFLFKQDCPFCRAVAYTFIGEAARGLAKDFETRVSKGDHACILGGDDTYVRDIISYHRVAAQAAKMEGTGEKKHDRRVMAFLSDQWERRMGDVDDEAGHEASERMRAMEEHLMNLEWAHGYDRRGIDIDEARNALADHFLGYYGTTRRTLDLAERIRSGHYYSNRTHEGNRLRLAAFYRKTLPYDMDQPATPCPMIHQIMEGNDTHKLFADDTGFALVPIADIPGKVGAFLQLTRESHRRHEIETALRMVHRPATYESVVAGSSPVDFSKHAAYMMCSDGYANQATIYAHTKDRVVLLTCRHRLLGGSTQPTDGVRAAGEVICVKTMRGEYQATILKIHAEPADDQVAYLLTCRAPTATVQFAEPGVGDAVQAVYYDEPNDTWLHLAGNVTGRAGFLVGYDMSTKAGCCRMGVYNRSGKLVAGHFLSQVVYGDGRAVPSGGVARRPPNNVNDWDVAPYQPCVPMLQGRVAAAPPLTTLDERFPMSRIEHRRIHHLQQRDLTGILTNYHLMKPSTFMNKRELRRFADVLEYHTDDHAFEQAIRSALKFDRGVAQAYIHPTRERFLEVIDSIGGLSKAAGPYAYGKLHPEYIDSCGGREAMADRLVALYEGIVHGTQNPDTLEMMRQCSYWSVIGKFDGYKASKLDVGRTIQCPSFEMKALWLAIMEHNDKIWNHQGKATGMSWVHCGEDFDEPVSAPRVASVLQARGALSLDQTAFDRHMQPEYIKTFFHRYLPAVRPGFPLALRSFLLEATLRSKLVHTDGTVVQKESGNPSGFMNTLRLNCWAGLLAWLYAVQRRLEQMESKRTLDAVVNPDDSPSLVFEICGDDSRVWAMDDFAVTLLGLPEAQPILDIWEAELPWAAKVEGSVLYPDNITPEDRFRTAPPMVARRYLVIGRWVWEPLYNLSRCMKVLVHMDFHRLPGGKEEEELVLSFGMCASVLLSLHEQGHLVSPVLDAYRREFLSRFPHVERQIRERVHKLGMMLGRSLPLPVC